jgi:predicted DNA binding protein
MHEFLFSLTYEQGVDDYADLFIEHDDLRAEAVYSCLDPAQLWRLEVLTGEAATLDVVTPLVLDESRDRESISERTCEADRQFSLLTDTGRRRVVYSYLSDVRRCDAVPVITAQYLSGGSLVELTRHGAEARWRILMQNDDKAGMLYDTLGSRLADGVRFRFERFTEVDSWQHSMLAANTLPNEQQETLAVAVEEGYFETPREVTLDELADQLGVPRSTVSYRLRRAVREVVGNFVRN